MKRIVLRNIVIITGILILITTFPGCGRTKQQKTPGTDGEISGSILALGSTALQPLAQEAARQFKNKNPNTDIQVQGGGSGNGLSSVYQGTAQIGNSDIFAEEKAGIDPKALEDHKVCVAGFAVIVNPVVKVGSLTKQQLVDIFTGKVTNWGDVGGDNMDIAVIGRPASSGTRATFKKYGLGGAEEAAGKTLTEDSSGAVLQSVSQTNGAVSYVGISYIQNNKSVKTIKLNGVEPSAENIASGKYPIWSYEHMYTKGPAVGLTKSFIDYILSDESKPTVQKLGYIPMGDMKVTR